MRNIVCTIADFTEAAKKELENLGTVTCITPTQEDLASALTEAEIVVAQLGLQFDKTVLDAAPNLKFIATATTGLDHIDVAHAETKGITVVSLKGETEFLRSITSTAELALGLMIALARHIPRAHHQVLGGQWNREGNRGYSLSGKTLGIIGMGRLGTLMAQYGESLGMNSIFTDPEIAGGTDLETLLRESDVISIHVHLQEDTERLIDAHAIATLKSGALLINTARGKIVDENAVIEALESGHLGGYATDVLSDELNFVHGKATSKLIDYAKNHSNVIITPHIGGTTVESRQATDMFIVKKLLEKLESV